MVNASEAGSSGECGPLDSTVGEFLDLLSSRTPTPGGGSAAAVCGALGAALGRMVAGFSDGAGEPARIAGDRLQRADQMLRRLIAEDMAAYEALAKAMRDAKSSPDHASAKQQAAMTAALVPLEIAATASGALEEMHAFMPHARKYLLSDLGVSADLAEACVRAAGWSVRVNLPMLAESDARGMAEQLDRLMIRSQTLRSEVYTFVTTALQK